LAAAQGDGDAAKHTAKQSIAKDAAKSRNELAAIMTPEQIAEAQRLAREWKPTK
jgi:hypothetical protein